MVHLTKAGILPLETVRLNRVPVVEMLKEKEMKTSEELMLEMKQEEKKKIFQKENAHKLYLTPTVSLCMIAIWEIWEIFWIRCWDFVA
nr:unnamed protein product [Callosobruchus analis]